MNIIIQSNYIVVTTATTQEIKSIKKSRYNLNKLSSMILDFVKSSNPTLQFNNEYTLSELITNITGNGVTICKQSFAIEHIQKLQNILEV